MSQALSLVPITRDNQWVSSRCLVVDDDAFTRTTVAAALRAHGVDVVAAASGIAQAMDVDIHDVECAVLDLDLGTGPNGIDLAHALRRKKPSLGIVILTSFSDPRLLAASVKAPPIGSTYVVKQSLEDMDILVTAIRATVEHYHVPEAGNQIPLTDAQVETLRLLAYGLSNAEIARVRVVTEKSVEQAIKRVAVALEVDTSPQANQRVALARAYFALTGATRHTHAHR